MDGEWTSYGRFKRPLFSNSHTHDRRRGEPLITQGATTVVPTIKQDERRTFRILGLLAIRCEVYVAW